MGQSNDWTKVQVGKAVSFCWDYYEEYGGGPFTGTRVKALKSPWVALLSMGDDS